MYKRFFGLSFFYFSCCVSLSQTSNISPITHLYHSNKTISSIRWDGKEAIEPDSSHFSKLRQYLIKNKEGLFMVLNGSGRLYKAETGNGRIIFKRLDSTIYYGSNFGSYIFNYNDTIFSLGGYGFWKTNGLLRYYIPSRREWEIIRLNKEVPLLTENIYDLIWYDESEQKIYFGFTREENNVTKEKQPNSNLHPEVIVLDLQKKEWVHLGKLSPFLETNLINIRNIVSSPYGQMINLGNRILFLNYRTNQIYRLIESKQRQIELMPAATGDTHTVYYIDSTFYRWLTAMNIVDSIKMEPGDIRPLNEKIFIPGIPEQTSFKKERFSFRIASYGFGAATLLFSLIYLLLRNRKTRLQAGSDNSNDNPNEFNNHPMTTFTPVELDLIRAILNNSTSRAYTSIDETNKILGVKNRDRDTQKKVRHDIISSVNKKFSFITKSEKDLIEKKRTESDGRSFEYFIKSTHLKDVSEIIHNAKK